MIRVEGIHGYEVCPVCIVNIGLPGEEGSGKFTFCNVPAVVAKIQDYDVLIGMDVICHGDFSISDGGKMFSFRVPSKHTQDFVEELKRATTTH